jgi:Putative amidase domain
MVFGVYTHNDVWWYSCAFTPSIRMSRKLYLGCFVQFSPISQHCSRPKADAAQQLSNLFLGDIIFADWDGPTGHHPDGRVDHVMIVTGKDTDGNLYISQHTNARLDRPMAQVLLEETEAQFYGFKVLRLNTPINSTLTGLVGALGCLLAALIITSAAGCDRGFRTFANNKLSPKDQQLAAEMKGPIKTYLEQNVGEIGFEGKTFCAHKVLGIDQSGDQIDAYIYAMCQEYYLKGQDLTKGTGLALPVALLVQRNGTQYRVVSHETPGDGARFSADVERIFPRNIHQQIFSAPMNSRGMEDAIETEAKQYFHK